MKAAKSGSIFKPNLLYFTRCVIIKLLTLSIFESCELTKKTQSVLCSLSTLNKEAFVAK